MLAKKFTNQDELQKLRQKLQTGKRLHIYFGEENINNEKIEVREVVDNEHIVFRTKNEVNNTYAYRMKDILWFYTLEQEGCLLEIE
jgi:hypothetical protein